MVPADPLYLVFLEELRMLVPALTFNPFTVVQTIMLGGLTLGALGLGG